MGLAGTSSGVAQTCGNRRWSSSVRGDLKPGEADVAIVGGGIVGLATAREIVNRFPSAKVVVVEKEQDIVKHQTSHNRCDLTFHFNCRVEV
jgi:threonine dehydrogenase-like Zn-dependent dehydrogenase